MNQKERMMEEGTLFMGLFRPTMAQLCVRMGMVGEQARFDHFFQDCPACGDPQGGYRIEAGLEGLTDWHIPIPALARCAPADRRVWLSWIPVSNAS
jgi:hypothetical protein